MVTQSKAKQASWSVDHPTIGILQRLHTSKLEWNKEMSIIALLLIARSLNGNGDIQTHFSPSQSKSTKSLTAISS